MTTIAARFSTGEMAADSMCAGDDVHYHVSKLHRAPRSLFGGAGQWDTLLRFYAHLTVSKGAPEALLKILEPCGDIEVLELREDGLYVYESCYIATPIKNDFYAVGTGRNFAIAAMHLGASPSEAVALAALYDPNTGGPVEEMRLGDIVTPPTVAKRGKKKK
jgi:hypothetical protein